MRTPGLCSAAETAWLLELEELDPQAATPSAYAATAVAANTARTRPKLPTVT